MRRAKARSKEKGRQRKKKKSKSLSECEHGNGIWVAIASPSPKGSSEGIDGVLVVEQVVDIVDSVVGEHGRGEEVNPTVVTSSVFMSTPIINGET